MDKRLTFNEDVENFEKWRPTYGAEVFEDIIAYSQIARGKKAIEVGIGTGHATKPILETGCELTAIELGKDLAEYSQSKFREYRNFAVVNTTFEEYECPENSIDLLYSATAFHWIPDEVGYPKAYKLLKTGGTLALFWNRPFVSRQEDALHRKIQQIYQTYIPFSKKIVEHDIEKYENRKKTVEAYGFREQTFQLYHSTRSFSSSDYVALLNTYSDHRTMPSTIKDVFEDEVREAILQYGDQINVFDTVDLYLARK